MREFKDSITGSKRDDDEEDEDAAARPGRPAGAALASPDSERAPAGTDGTRGEAVEGEVVHERR
jgi:hypothetical protein